MSGSRRQRLVVVGNGMVGSRLVEEVQARGGAGLWHTTVVGSEEQEAYNRIQLSGVLAGSHREDDLALGLPGAYCPDDVQVRTGSAVVRVHRSTRTVHLDDGAVLPYDRVVLATGSNPVLPPLPGLLRHDPADPERGASLHPQAFAFRSLADCRGILGAARTATRAVVVGGGLLGLEAARGLSARGLGVEVVQMPAWLMNGQLDPEAGEVLRRTLQGLGITSYLGARATGVVTDAAGGLTGLRLADQHVLDCDLLVFAAGVRPSTRLAREARLATGRGVVVDATLRSPTDPRVHAVGDCAEVDGAVSGLVGTGWEQAAALAGTLTAPQAPPVAWRRGRSVTRLKASGIDLASLGEITPTPADSDGDLEVLSYSDYTRGVYKKVVLRGGRVVGGILLGDVSSVGTLTLAFDRGSPVPPDRLQLLFRAGHDEQPNRVADAAAAPDEATICHCNDVSAGQLRRAVRTGACSTADLARCTRAGTGCGTCTTDVAAILARVLADDRAEVPADRADGPALPVRVPVPDRRSA